MTRKRWPWLQVATHLARGTVLPRAATMGQSPSLHPLKSKVSAGCQDTARAKEPTQSPRVWRAPGLPIPLDGIMATLRTYLNMNGSNRRHHLGLQYGAQKTMT